MRFLITVAATALFVSACCEPLIPKQTTQPKPPLPALPDADEVVKDAPIPFVINSIPSSNTVSFRFVFTSGSTDDPKGKKGLSLLTAALITQGGTQDLSYSKIVDNLFPTAASVDFDMDRDQTVFYGRVHKDHLKKYYKIFSDILLFPRLSQKDFDRIKEQQKSALTLNLRGNDDEELGKAALALAMYGDHPYGAPVLGTKSGIEAITLDDIKKHRNSIMCRSRLTVGLAGAVTDEFIQQVRADMEKLPRDCTAPPALPDVPETKGRKVLLVEKPTAESTAISIGFPIDVTRGQPDYAALKLVEAYFGQHRTFAGRLQLVIRMKRGFNYGNYAYSEYFEQEGQDRIPKTNMSRRAQHFSIWIRPVKDVDKHFVLRMALDELEKLIRDGISQKILDKTRTYIKRYYRTFAQTEQRTLGYALDDHFYGQDKPYFEKLFADLDALSVTDVNTAIKKHLTADNLNIAMVTKDAQKLASLLASDAPSKVTYTSEKPAEILKRDAQIEVKKLNIKKDDITIIKVDSIFEK